MKRNYLFDNLKVLLIFLVVFGHFSERYINSDISFKNIYIYIYMFHMPLFVFASGYFSKNVDKCREKAIQDLLVPFIVLNALYYACLYFVGGITDINIFIPGWTLWYLISLFFWRFFLKDIVRLERTSLILCISVLSALLIGIVEKNTTFLSLSRTFGFLPFFLIGYYADDNLINKIKKIPSLFSIVGLVLIGSITCIIIKHFSLRHTILYLSTSYKSFGLTITQGIMFRIIFYIFSMLMCIFIINLMPNSEHKISKIGRKTMIIYVGHTAVLFLIQKFIPVYKSTFIDGGIALLATILIVLLLSIPIFERAYNNFFVTISKILRINKIIKTKLPITD